MQYNIYSDGTFIFTYLNNQARFRTMDVQKYFMRISRESFMITFNAVRTVKSKINSYQDIIEIFPYFEAIILQYFQNISVLCRDCRRIRFASMHCYLERGACVIQLSQQKKRIEERSIPALKATKKRSRRRRVHVKLIIQKDHLNYR